jgi:hypothetical protein
MSIYNSFTTSPRKYSGSVPRLTPPPSPALGVSKCSSRIIRQVDKENSPPTVPRPVFVDRAAQEILVLKKDEKVEQTPVKSHKPATNPSMPQFVDQYTPAKRTPVTFSPGGTASLDFSPRTAAAMARHPRVIYSWKVVKENPQEGEVAVKRLIGGTGRGTRRLKEYMPVIKKSEKPFGVDARANRKGVSVGVVKYLKEDENSGDEEDKAIKAKRSRVRDGHGYNVRGGGGGGRCHKADDSVCPHSIPEIVAMIQASYKAPKSRPFVLEMKKRMGKDREVFAHTLSEEEKKLKQGIYEIVIDTNRGATHKKDSRNRVVDSRISFSRFMNRTMYRRQLFHRMFQNLRKHRRITHHVGYTTTPIGKRFSALLSGVNNPDKPYGRVLKVYDVVRRAFRKNPAQVVARIHDVSKLTEKGIPLPMLETAFMKFFKGRHENVRNIGHGGKGSVARR